MSTKETAAASVRPIHPPIPDGYKPGDYIPFVARDPEFPTTIAARWDDAPPPSVEGRVIERYASWGQRVGAHVVDTVIAVVFAVPLVLGYISLTYDVRYASVAYAGDPQTIVPAAQASDPTVALFLLGLLFLPGYFIYNVVLRQGRTGYTFGKSILGIRLVSAATGQPLGARSSFARQIAHVADSLFLYLGWLLPLWDRRGQTFADKVMGSVVVQRSSTAS